MATNYWTAGTANWNTPSDWSAGLPDPSSDVVIQSGEGHYYSNPQVTASFGAVNSITIASASVIADLTFIDAGASSVTGDVITAGGLLLDPFSGDGGSSLTIGGVLGTHFYYSGSSAGVVQIGPSDGTLRRVDHQGQQHRRSARRY